MRTAVAMRRTRMRTRMTTRMTTRRRWRRARRSHARTPTGTEMPRTVPCLKQTHKAPSDGRTLYVSPR